MGMTSVLLVSQSEDTGRDVATALQESPYSLAQACNNMGQVVKHLESSSACAVLVDIDAEPRQTLAGLEAQAKRFADTRFIVLSSKMESTLMLEAMQAGARHFLQKRSITDELGPVLRRLAPDALAGLATTGSVVNIMSASGGCGATTLAVNLANEINAQSGDSTLLVDLDDSYGGAATYLGVGGQYGVADVLRRNGELDPELIRSTAQSYSEGVEMLISPATVDMSAPAELMLARLGNALRVCRGAYPFTVFDAPRISMDAAGQLVAGSLKTYLVFQLAVKDLGTSRAMISALRDHGVATDNIVGVVNRYKKRRSMVTLEDAQAALPGMKLTCLSNDYVNTSKALNYGKLLAHAAPRSPLYREIKQLAADVIGAAEASSRADGESQA